MIKLTGINKIYRTNEIETVALENVNLEVNKGEFLSIMGPSGCGKSTFLRLLNRMNDLIPDTRLTGEILIDGQDIYKKGVQVDELRKNVGMVFQRPNPFPTLSIYDNVIAGYRLNGIRMKKQERDEIVEKSLRDVALWDEVKDTLHSKGNFLSGGQQQRLCLARTIAFRPKVILLDEPTSALDPISTSKIEDLLVELKKDYTIIMVTHNMQQALRISDRTAFFLLGEVVECNKTSALFSMPEDPRTEDYITGRFG